MKIIGFPCYSFFALSLFMNIVLGMTLPVWGNAAGVMGHGYADKADVTVLRVNIDTDSNHDGMMNDADDLTEENSPGKLIAYNRESPGE